MIVRFGFAYERHGLVHIAKDSLMLHVAIKVEPIQE